MEHLIRFLHATYAAPADGVSDAELLGRCAAGTDDAAFELLVRRHAELVWKVCRAVARDHHAAEDAFQATFLALARKAAAVRERSAAGWLARVAYHAALKARAASRGGGDKPRRSLGECWREDRSLERDEVALLHDELNRLPEAYRVPVVLCHLHGFTQVEAARQLGLPVGTVATRVRRGLGRLRDRLTRRGVAIPAAGVGGLLGAASASAVPRELVSGAARAGGSVPAHITRLSEGALSAMRSAKWKLAAALSVAAAACAVGAAVVARSPEEPPKPTPPQPAAPTAAKKAAAPSTYAQREGSRKNIERIAYTFHAYLDDHGHWPADITGKDGKPLLSWRVAILPYLDQDYLYSQFKLDEPWDSEHNKKLLPHMPKVFRSPVQGDGPASETYFQGFAGPGAGFEPGKKLNIGDFTDGTSNTIMLAEAGPPVPWTKPIDRPYDPKKPLPAMDGPYADRIISSFWDGSVIDLRWNMDEKDYRLLIERADGTVIPEGTLDPPPDPPLSEEDKELIKRSRKRVANQVEHLAQLDAERKALLAEFAKIGRVPQPAELRPDAGVDDWKDLEKRLDRQERALWGEVWWLRQELERRKKGRK